MNNHKAIGDAPTMLRLAASGLPEGSKVDRDNKRISGISVMTVGPALGHGLWIDGHALESLAALKPKTSSGFKSRYTHPGLSSDGMGKQVGRVSGISVEGEQAFGDLQLYKRSHQGLVNDTLNLAEEDPDAFGTSVVVARDFGAEEAFAEANKDDGKFKSPDAANTDNLPHMRIAEMRAVDIVDEPAANPGGLFSAMGDGNELPAQAFDVLDFVFGLSNDPPEPLMGIHPERVKNTFQSYLGARNISTVFEDPEADDESEWLVGESPYLDQGTTTESNKEPDPTGAVSQSNEREESEMADNLKDLTAEQLGTERPDLVEKLQADLRTELEGKAKAQLNAETARCVGIVEAGEKLGLVDGISERLTSCQSVSEATIQLQDVKLAQYAKGSLPAREIAGTASDKTHEAEAPKPPAKLTEEQAFEARVEELTKAGTDPGDALIQADQERLAAEKEDK